MSPGDVDLFVRARSVLLDALLALHEHRQSVVVIGAQAVYLHTGAAAVNLPEATKDSDLALDSRSLGPVPRIEAAMADAGFVPNPHGRQPGSWVDAHGVPVDLMVPEALAGQGGRRGARIPPHSSKAARRATGLEATVVDNAAMEIRSLSEDDGRSVKARVAGPASLLVAKMHKIGERAVRNPDRLVAKDAHDVYRILVAIETEELATRLSWLLADELAGDVTTQAMHYLRDLFADGPTAVGSSLAGLAEEGVGDPEVASAATSALAADLAASVLRP